MYYYRCRHSRHSRGLSAFRCWKCRELREVWTTRGELSTSDPERCNSVGAKGRPFLRDTWVAIADSFADCLFVILDSWPNCGQLTELRTVNCPHLASKCWPLAAVPTFRSVGMGGLLCNNTDNEPVVVLPGGRRVGTGAGAAHRSSETSRELHCKGRS